MKILFVFLSLPHLKESSMYSDLINEFNDNGHEVFPMAPCNLNRSVLVKENNIDVIRVSTWDLFSKNLIFKGLANLLLPYQYRLAFEKHLSTSIDLVIVATPSVMFADFILFVKKKYDCRVFLLLKDIFPQNAVDLGFLKKNSITYKYFKSKELKLLSNVDFIGCTSPGNVRYVKNNYNFLRDEVVKLLYNSSKLFEIGDFEHHKNFLEQEYGKKYFVAFGGNLGKPQQLENILLLAKRVSHLSDVLFVFIGAGTEGDSLLKLAGEWELSNIKFIPKLSRERYFRVLISCDLALISLHKDFTVPNTPLKLNDYLNAQLPILASIDRHNDLGSIIVNNGMGRFAYADSPEDLFKEFLSLYKDKTESKRMGMNGYLFCLKNLSIKNTYKEILLHLNSAN